MLIKKIIALVTTVLIALSALIPCVAFAKDSDDVSGAVLMSNESGISNYIPGDLNDDGKVDMTDVIILRRHIAVGFNQSFVEMAADVNNDRKNDNADVDLIRKHIVGGYNVNLVPAERDEYSITYYLHANDDYLKSLEIENPNPPKYTKQEGLELQDLHVDGYNFLGWFTAQSGGSQVTEYAIGTTGNKNLYAHWEKVEYKVQFACDMDPQENMAFTAGEEVVLPIPEMDKYTFVGWCDKDGNMWDSIPKGTAKNVTLYANWSSNRNKAVAKKDLGEPLIMEDSEAGLILFTYEIGEIQNVPLFTTLNLQCANGIITTVSQTGTEEISEENAKTIAKTVASATTNSSSWTLENNWSNTTEVSQSYLDQTNQTREEAEALAKSESGTYNLSSSSSGYSNTTNNSYGSFNLSMNKANSKTEVEERGNSIDLSVDAKFANEMNVGASIPIKVVKLDVGNKSNFEIGAGADYNQYKKNTDTGTKSWSKDVDISNERSKTTVDEKSWNTASGYENSKTTSSNTSVSNAVSKLISQEYGYGSSYAEGGSNSSSQEFATTDSTSDEYSSTVTYHSSKIVSTTKEFQTTGNTMGGYRMVMAGKIHVFAVIGYDIAEQSYFVYTYNVMDDKTEEYLDFSRDHSFNDYETSIIPFEIPSFVNDYVNTRIAKTSGLQIDPDTGIIMDYYPDEENPDTIVIIPSYMSVDNGDGTYTSVKVKGISEGLFKNNKNIKGVKLGNFITEIPDSAFEGCANLKYVVTPGVTKIGNNAFKGCTSLSDFTIPIDVTEVGTNAFNGASGVNAVAANASVAKAIASSGAENIVLDISNVTDSGLSFEVGNISSFELQGKAKDYKGLKIKSDAASTIINGVNFTECSGTPMDFSSSKVTLNRVNAAAPGYALIMSASDTTLLLNQTVTLTSTTDNAVICKNITLKPLTTSVVGKLSLGGNMLVAGTVTNDKYLTFTKGKVVTITEEEFENTRSLCSVTLDANGGTLATTTMDVAYGTPVGELPKPTYGEYVFVGWCTDKNCTIRLSDSTPVTSTMTLYAKWNNWDGTSTEPAYDASTKTYTITTGNELAWISGVSNGKITTGTNLPENVEFKGYTLVLENDIHLNDTTNYQNWKTTAPKNKWVNIKSFNGTFDGHNHSVYGIYSDSLFNTIQSEGMLKNLIVDKGYINKYASLGSIGCVNEGEVVNCVNCGVEIEAYYAGKIQSRAYAIGGVFGSNRGKMELCGNYANVSIKKSEYRPECEVGGIVGSTTEGSITNLCWNKGSLYSDSDMGGITAFSRNYVGGIVGGGYGGEITKCYNSGEIYGYRGSGGILGYFEEKTRVINCHNQGSLNSNDVSCGIATYGDDVSQINYCYDIGSFNSPENYGISLGVNYMSYCYSSTTPVVDEDYEDSTVSYKSLTAMKNLSKLDGFDSSVWAVDPQINNGYPYLIDLKDTY